ncbi:MAG TPA: molybdopterin dinucleotide binding domain-containing protein, partial [Geobacteraceae bacterium]|nr:molybdopterin dinucleotide binding domain-containing protein [Geobacteraceae bacterium]
QARSDFEILNQLCAVLAGTPAYTDAAATFAEIAASVPAYQGMTLDALGDDGVVHEASGTSKFVAVTGAPVAAEAGKLALVTGSALNHCGTLSRFGEGPMYVCPEGYVELGREDASSLGIKEGDQVTVKSAGAEIRLKAKVGSRLPKGVVFAPYHFGDQSVNNLSTGAAVTWVSIGK